MRRAKTSCIVAFCIALPAVSFILATAAGSILFTTIPPQDTSSKNLANTESSVQDFRKDIPETQEAAGIIQQKRERIVGTSCRFRLRINVADQTAE